MKQVVVLSGKGGTGKTTVTGALARSLANPGPLVLVDADVDAADLALLLDPTAVEEHAYEGMPRCAVDPDRCSGCGACADVCRFGAVTFDDIGAARVDPLACEGCLACVRACPTGAVGPVRHAGGTWWRSMTAWGDLFHAELAPGEESSGRLVAALRDAARRRAEDVGADVVLIDGPPGIACPAIAAAAGVDLGVVVAEPTVAAEHDLGRALDLLAHFAVPALVVVNKATAAPEAANRIAAAVRARGVEAVATVPYDRAVVAAVRAGRPVGVGARGPASVALEALSAHLSTWLAGGGVSAPAASPMPSATARPHRR